jgi:long-chain-fatty-acid--CoA ligase ACSBG
VYGNVGNAGNTSNTGNTGNTGNSFMNWKIYIVRPNLTELQMDTEQNKLQDGLPENLQPYFTTDPRKVVKLRYNVDNWTAHDSANVIELFGDAVRDYGDDVAMGSKTPLNVFNAVEQRLVEFPGYNTGDEKWFTMTWKELHNNVLQCAYSLIKSGVKPFDVVNIIGFNSPQWIIANLGAIFAGAIPGGIYSTSTPEACLQISSQCNATVVFVENETQLSKYLQIWDQLPNLRTIVQWGGVVPKLDSKFPVLTWNTFMNPKGSTMCTAGSDEELCSRMRDIEPGRVCTLIFTSGTTGVPKTVMLSHDNITWTARIMWDWVASGFNFEEQQHQIVSYLPLSHIAAQMQDIYCAMCGGCAVWFASPDALRGSLSTTLKEVQPTIFFGVPRVWEKFQEKIMEVGERSGSIKKRLVSWAKSVGKNAEEPSGIMWNLASFIAFSKVKKALGLDRCVAFYSGAAPLQSETEIFFAGVGIRLRQLFGMSECSGPHTVSVPYNPIYGVESFLKGTCGPTMWGCKTKIGNKSEVLITGRNIMMGYMSDASSTLDSIDIESGFLKTGDIGELDSQHELQITGRLKELIITAGGENISPLVIENTMKADLPYIQDCVAIGDRKKYISLLITLRTVLNSEQQPTNVLHPNVIKFARDRGSTSTTVEEAHCDKVLHTAIQNDIVRANYQLPSRAMQVKQWAILKVSFTVAGGELGPTSKVKRTYILSKYSKFIEEMYTKLFSSAPPQQLPEKKKESVSKTFSPEEASVYIRALLEHPNNVKGIFVFGPGGTGKSKSIAHALRVDPDVELSPVALLPSVAPETVKEQITSAKPNTDAPKSRDSPMVLILESRYTPEDFGTSLEGFTVIFIPKKSVT